MVKAIEDERRKNDRHYCWGNCSCLHTLEGCRSFACAVPPSQQYNITDCQRYVSELFNPVLSPPWDPATSGMAASLATVCCRRARYECLTWDVYSSPCLWLTHLRRHGHLPSTAGALSRSTYKRVTLVMSGQVSILDCYRVAPSGTTIHSRILWDALAYKPLSSVHTFVHVPLC